MENKAVGEQPLGPSPAPRRAPLSRARAAVLDAVAEAGREESGREEGGAADLSRLARLTGLHANTLREHLDALVAEGLVRRSQAAPKGRGRPAQLYEAVDAAAAEYAAPEYAGLAATLAGAIHRSSPDPAEDAVLAGTDWGRELAAAHPKPPRDDAGPRDRVVALFDRMGFGPRVDTASTGDSDTVHLTRCPLLDAARRYPDVVCGVHLGIARGALTEYDAADSTAQLQPFAEPGACVLHLTGTGRS